MSEKLTLADDAKGICEEVVARHFMPVVKYQHERVPLLVGSITESIVQRLTQEAALPRKYIAHCVIIQKNGAGFHALSACSWNPSSDACYVHHAENKGEEEEVVSCMLRRCTVFLRTSFLTDVEGNFSYLLSFAELSKVVAWRNGTLAFRDDSSQFVYGGDAFDRGEDIRFAKALIDFHDAHPTRVHFILGNRDINKMVFGAPTEHVLAMLRTPEEAQRLTFPTKTQRILPRRSPTYPEYLASKGLPLVTSKATFVQWCLECKLGCLSTFDGRRKELHQIRGNNNGGVESISDEEVAESFLKEARSGGVYHEYLRRGKIAVVVDGVLFVHGGINEKNLGIVPDERILAADYGSTRGHNFIHERRSAEDWFRALNEFKENAFKQWALGGDGLTLRRYACPQSITPYSVTVGSMVHHNGPRYLGLDAVEYLNRSGITTVCSGHQPGGDTPCIVQQPGLLSIAADNSYSGERGTRGASVVEVLLEDDGSSYIHGQRVDGTPYAFTATDPLIGRHLGEGWWVKVKLDADLYEAHRTRDAYRSRDVQLLHIDDVALRLREWRETPVGGETAEWWTKNELAQRPGLIKTKRTRSS